MGDLIAVLGAVAGVAGLLAATLGGAYRLGRRDERHRLHLLMSRLDAAGADIAGADTAAGCGRTGD